MGNYLDKLKSDIQILIDSLDQVSNSKITFKKKHIPIDIDKKNMISTYFSLGSLWYEFYYAHFIEEYSPNQVNISFKFSEPLYRISQKHNPISINKNWHVEEILDKGNTLLLKKGFRSLFMDRGAVYTEKPYEVITKYSKINLLDSSGFQFESDDTWIRVYGKNFPRSTDDTIRYYFNINQNKDSYRILGFLNSIIKEFNESKVVFNLKVLGNRKDFLRADCLVIYVEKRSLLNSFCILEQIYQEFKDIFRNKTPLFTRALGQGWGVAEEPNNVGDTSSFGQIRIRQLSEIFINYIVNNGIIPTVDEVLKEINNIHGCEEKYYLNNDSKILIPNTYQGNGFTFNEGNPKIDFLKSAINIANLLGSQAIWSYSILDTQCLWIRNYKEESRDLSSTVCGVKMLGGTSGISFFYSILYKKTGNEYFKFLAQGALNYSINIFFARSNDYLKDQPYSKSIYIALQKINIISFNIDVQLEDFKSQINVKIGKNFDEILKKNEIEDDLIFILFILKSRTIELSTPQMTFIKSKIITSTDKLKESNILFSVSILLKIDTVWIDDEKEFILGIIDKMIERYFKNQVYKNPSTDFFENFREIIFIYSKLKKHFGKTLKDVQEIIDFFKVKWLDAQNKEEKYTFHNEGLFQYFEFLEILSKLFPQTFTPLYVATLIKIYSDKLVSNFLQYDSFPTFNLGEGVYNPGLYDGVAGIGYFFLKQYDSELPLLNEVEWKF